MTWLHIFKWPGIPTAKPTHLRHVWEHHRSPWAPGCSDRSIFIVRQLLGHHRWTQFNGKASKHPSKVACLKLSVWCFFFSKNSESFDEFFISTTKNGPTTFHTHTHTPQVLLRHKPHPQAPAHKSIVKCAGFDLRSKTAKIAPWEA